jgi:sugar lactone lactonase YvrE
MEGRHFQTLFDKGLYLEGPRWHAGKLWCVDSLRREVLAIDLAGNTVKICDIKGVAGGAGFLPGGDLVVTSMFTRRLLRLAGGRLETMTDLSPVASGSIDDMIIDGMGRIYVGDLGFDLTNVTSTAHDKGRLILVTSNGEARAVAEDLHFPNGIAVSEDGKMLIVAESSGNRLARFEVRSDGSLQFQGHFGNFCEPDGICLDNEGAVWVSLYQEDAFVRVDLTGNILDRISVAGRRAVACVLGGTDRRTLLCISAETSHEDLMKGNSTARIDAVNVNVAGAGYP